MAVDDVGVVFVFCAIIGVIVFAPWLFGNGVTEQDVTYVGKGEGYRSGSVVAYESLSEDERAVFKRAVENGSTRVDAVGMWDVRGRSYLIAQNGTIYQFQTEPVMFLSELRYFVGSMSLLLAASTGLLLVVQWVQKARSFVRLHPPDKKQ